MSNLAMVNKLLDIALILSLVVIPVRFASKGKLKETGLSILELHWH